MNEAHNIRDRRICKCVGVLFFILNSIFCFSQQPTKGDVYKYARKIVDTLASPSMHGRGYVNGGDSIAAKYISDRFLEFGLKDFAGMRSLHDPAINYYQRFDFLVNTFPGKMIVKINGKLLIPGKDFIIHAEAGTCKTKCKRIISSVYPLDQMLDTRLCECRSKNTAIFFNGSSSNSDSALKNINHLWDYCYGTAIFIVRKEKLTWDVSRDCASSNFCMFEILEKSLPKKIEKVEIDEENRYDHPLDKTGHKIIGHQCQNIISYIKGTQFPDSFIVYTAHYDHLGVMGKDANGKEVYFPGANDNASGCAMLLNLAKYYSQHPPKYSIAFMAFGAEEAGLVGSKFYTEHPLFPLKQIKFLVNFDIMGTGDEGIKVVNATEFPLQFATLQKLNAQGSYLKEVSPRGKTSNSDHYFFYQNGVKCFYIYTLGGIKAYHDIYDRPETLPLTKFEEVFNLMRDFSDWLQN